MADRKARNKRRRGANKSSRAATQTGKRSLKLIVGLTVFATVVVVGSAVALLFNGEEELPQAQSVAGRSIPPSGSGVSLASATIGSKVGNRIPDITMRLNNGNTVSTAGLVDEGKPTFLFFFATW